MTTVVKNLLSACTVLLFLALAAASSSTKNFTFSKDHGEIPPDFCSPGDTLVVVSHPENWGYDHYLRKNFKENYFGNYKIIREKEFDNYPPETYRYVFDYKLTFTTKTTTTETPLPGGRSDYSTHSFTSVSSSSFHIEDRKTNTTYSTISSAHYWDLMKAYLKALEDVRQK